MPEEMYRLTIDGIKHIDIARALSDHLNNAQAKEAGLVFTISKEVQKRGGTIFEVVMEEH